jgi:hypothetical protein
VAATGRAAGCGISTHRGTAGDGERPPAHHEAMVKGDDAVMTALTNGAGPYAPTR